MSITSIIARWHMMPSIKKVIRYSVYCMCLMGFLISPTVTAAPVLQAVDIGDLPGGRIQLRFQLSEPAADPRSFTINDPARIVLDFMNVQSGLSDNQQKIGQGVAEQLTILEGGDRTRAAINLSRMVPYTIRTQGTNVLLTLDTGSSAAVSSAPPSSSQRSRKTAGQSGSGLISAIDFRRGLQGQGIINITLTSPNITVDVRDQEGQIIADFINGRLPRGQERRLDVTDFATPVSMIDAFNRNENARLVIQRDEDTEFLAYQTDDRYIIEVSTIPEDEAQVDAQGQRIYTGELLSLNFQDIEVRAVLQIIADFTGLNVVVSDTVQGNLTLRLQNVPWDQALDIIMQTKGLTQRQNGNVIFIAPTEEVTAREKLLLEAEKAKEELTPLESAVLQINYAKAEDLAKLIKERSGGTEDDTNLLSARGQISADPRTNNILLVDIPAKIADVRALLNKLDVPVRQVLIDSRIVTANDDFTREIGVQWGFAGAQRVTNGLASISGSAAGADAITGSAIGNLTATGQPFPVEVPALADRLGVNLGVTDPSSSIAFALLGQNYLVDLELSALQAEGRGEVLSNPRVITTDRTEASIIQGQTVTFIAQSDDDDQRQAVEANLELKVTPQITPDGRVILDLLVTKNDIDNISGLTVVTNEREVTTQALVDDGETVVLGGVFENNASNGIRKVPFLGDVPLLGELFKNRTKTINKRELLIFVTPQIIQPGGVRVR